MSLTSEDNKIRIELSVNEAMALGLGVRYAADSSVATNARKKVNEALEAALFQIQPRQPQLHYELIEA
ncbi:hypothetical protein [Paenibacillus sp. YYML68]|uniref:hypothetical protein n=1 Tax=Paenibacillus sp. YYML68 TaxID=2909250 RepID=UPI00248F73B6|nr:hypothetical protein [Paenibacillus sp. YYML68]